MLFVLLVHRTAKYQKQFYPIPFEARLLIPKTCLPARCHNQGFNNLGISGGLGDGKGSREEGLGP